MPSLLQLRLFSAIAVLTGLLVVLGSSSPSVTLAQQAQLISAPPVTHTSAKIPEAEDVEDEIRERAKQHVQAKVNAVETYGKLPLSFEANVGQTDDKVKFLSRGRGYT